MKDAITPIDCVKTEKTLYLAAETVFTPMLKTMLDDAQEGDSDIANVMMSKFIAYAGLGLPAPDWMMWSTKHKAEIFAALDAKVDHCTPCEFPEKGDVKLPVKLNKADSDRFKVHRHGD